MVSNPSGVANGVGLQEVLHRLVQHFVAFASEPVIVRAALLLYLGKTNLLDVLNTHTVSGVFQYIYILVILIDIDMFVNLHFNSML